MGPVVDRDLDVVDARLVRRRRDGPRDVPWLRVQWADGTLPGMSFTEIVAIRRPTSQALSSWQSAISDPLPLPTIEDYPRPTGED
ncbi:hypothetical protein [Nonomuraea sp. KM90]|uniref:hypothetical protein n=1 Tax=Nonomuraea sp. KM90 TaxID=3457428 RepID=UPI003FCC79DF